MTVATKGQNISNNSDQTPAVPGSSDDALQVQNDMVEPEFPHDKLTSLDEKISNIRWVVPVLPEQELECLLKVSTELAKKNLDTKSEACQRFFRESLTISFNKIIQDDAVSSWKPNIHFCIQQNCLKLVELCVAKLPHDWFPLLDLLAMIFNPSTKFHTFNSARSSETAGPNCNLSEEELYARSSSDIRNPRGWLVDLINRFGDLHGFHILLERFQSGNNLSVSIVYALIKPFGFCYEYLTPHTIHKFMLPILEMIPSILDKITDDELKKEAKNESKSDNISNIIKAAKNLASRVPNQEELIRTLEGFRLKMILRQLQISSFNGKMNALNEINKVISSVTYYPNRHHGIEDDDCLTSERMAKWINENHVLEIVLRDSLHQPQYVEKLEKILRFVIKEKALSLSDLNAVWAAQAGKHEAIVKNVHDLLAKLAWDFSPEQLDHIFECFQTSWTSASKKQRERLLELIRRLAEDDKDGVMAHKVLTLFWNLAHAEDVPTEIMDQALTAHVKILDYSCAQERDIQKTVWLDKCVDELKRGDKWVLPALKQIREICILYEQSTNGGHSQRSHHIFYRQEVIERLQNQHSLVILVTNSLTSYMDRLRNLHKTNPELTSETYTPDGRYSHTLQVQERLNFLRFLLKDGQLWLCSDQAKQIWQCLAEKAVFQSDREACFKWFSKLMGDEPDLDPGINKDFFENNILQLDPTLVTESGIKCFERFFKAVNMKEGKLKVKRRSHLTEDLDLIGLDYLWKIVTICGEDIAFKAIEILKEVSTNLGPKLMRAQMQFHENFITECYDRLRAHYDTVTVLQESENDKKFDSNQLQNRIRAEAVKLCRVIRVLHEYLSECDNAFIGDRKILPLYRAYRGKHLALIIRFSSPNRPVEDLELFTHSNDTVASLRKNISRRIKPGIHCKLELSLNGECLDSTEDKKLLSQIPLRDKMLISAKIIQMNSNMASSQDSSSDSSTSSPQHPYDGPTIDTENSVPSVISPGKLVENFLPGVMMSSHYVYARFFCQLYQLGSDLGFTPLRDGAWSLLQIIPCDSTTMENWVSLLMSNSLPVEQKLSLDQVLTKGTPSEVLYNLEVLYAMLMPALDLTEKTYEFQYCFMTSGFAHLFLEMLTKNNFMSGADNATKRAAYLVVLKISKLILTSIAHVLVRLSEDHTPQETEVNGETVTTPGMFLKNALRSVPGHSDHIVRQVSIKLSQGLAQLIVAESEEGTAQADALFNQALNWELPDLATTLALVRLIWAASSNNLSELNASPEILHSLSDPNKQNVPISLQQEDILLCREALELLSIALVLNPSSLEHLCNDKRWPYFVTDLVLLNPSSSIRIAAAEQLITICTCGASSRLALQLILPLLFDLLDNLVIENADTCHEFFQLLCQLVNVAHITGCPLDYADTLLGNEVAWLRKARNKHEVLIEGHLGLAKELLCFMNPEQKCELGSDESGSLIRELLEDFLFPASKLMLQLIKTGQLGEDPATPICETPQTQAAAFELLIALCSNCVPNYQQLVEMLTEMFYSDPDTALLEWDYLPTIGPRPLQGFVGLKNACATCYMNSVLQQLYMVDSIRQGILSAEGAATDPNEDFSGEERLDLDADCTDSRCYVDDDRKDYNVGILKQVQAIFGNLAYSRVQYYVPKGLWRHFKLQGEPVNLREQQDAVEFFMSLVESLDEALKTLGHEQIMSKILGGSYSDQKICKECPHRYSKEEPFSVISVDIRNHSSLQDSMEQYVKGEILEGADAYHCEKCARKVVTVKRLCVKKLPPVLAIQLKRFEYDFERVCAIKFNDYFEFPRDLDMEPYTVQGLAKIEGEMIDCDLDSSGSEVCTKYRLSGIVVHSGQASGGHYYSYIRHRNPSGEIRWYKFDDGDVSECRMGEDEEMKVQCFGGEYMAEVFDPMMKRTTYRRQKRWWNAYMLFYTRQDLVKENFVKSLEDLSLSEKKCSRLKMPVAIENSIRKQNIKFLHHRSQFSVEYFQFIKKMAANNAHLVPRSSQGVSNEMEQQSLLSLQLVSNFLFHSGWHTKKNLRGPALEWGDVVCLHLRISPTIRSWFATNILFNNPQRFCEYLLSCPSNEVRTAFMKIVVLLAHFSINDGPCPPPLGFNNQDPNASLSDHILWAILALLQREVSEHGRHLPHYCNVFHMYANQGNQEKAQLLKMNVPATFMLVALDEGPGPAIKYQYTELGRLNQLVSCLIRCCDVSSKCQSSTGAPILPNPYGELGVNEYIMPISVQASEILYNNNSYIKKMIEDNNPTDETVKLLQFCCWENPHFSRIVLSELLWQIAFAYCQELRPHIEILLNILIIEDSWQTHRIHNALKGVPEDRDGLLDTINRAKNHYQKRAYQCIKCMVALFSKCAAAQKMLHSHADLKRQWIVAVTWLQEELERKYPQNSQYNYSTWSPPTQSNESSSGYYLERSNSARKTLERALELLPESEREDEYLSEREEEYLSEKEGQDDTGDIQVEAGPDMPDVTQSCETTSNP
ncbi:probable ubiquitin carboxyl-terminal hydrolase FAF-X [Coccinella septempunctata]|uniref:probable ubiquitin carboxyl-terminal hydrolase FAF-X n=1 Tax=Coccinella septempunctata TaxID=41139 RepID=UPI001D0763B9|nr:probable ubiquitin carboxyl-terminal hydrolase FAF-X [Coccinella septempunctata]XP_044752374.1 probable ubiquitin carboxyl-terminal hydrolase FAF-X [Coccinella septempunctata]